MTILVAICWNIWRVRNSRIFRDTSCSTYSCFLHITHDISQWTGMILEEERLQLSDDGIDGNGDRGGEEPEMMDVEHTGLRQYVSMTSSFFGF